MVFGAQVGLYAFAVASTTIVDMFPCTVAADERNRLDGWSIANEIDTIDSTVYNCGTTQQGMRLKQVNITVLESASQGHHT